MVGHWGLTFDVTPKGGPPFTASSSTGPTDEAPAARRASPRSGGRRRGDRDRRCSCSRRSPAPTATRRATTCSRQQPLHLVRQERLEGGGREALDAMLADAKAQGLPAQGRRDRLRATTSAPSRPLQAAADLREVPRPGDLLRLQGRAARRDAERLRHLQGEGPAAAADKALVAKLPKLDTTDGHGARSGGPAGGAALAARRGITLSASSGSSSGGTSVWVERGEIAGAVVLIGAARARAAAGSGAGGAGVTEEHEAATTTPKPEVQLGPSRPAFSKRTRLAARCSCSASRS